MRPARASLPGRAQPCRLWRDSVPWLRTVTDISRPPAPRAQLPLLHPGLEPRDEARWPALAAWYAGIEAQARARTARAPPHPAAPLSGNPLYALVSARARARRVSGSRTATMLQNGVRLAKRMPRAWQVPAYLARVKGDRHTWSLALAGAGGGATAVSSTAWADHDRSGPAPGAARRPRTPCTRAARG
jgi:hypothetical protein